VTPADGLAAHVVVGRGGFRLDTAVEAAAGQVLAVLGPNGAGKTSLLRALAGLLPLSAGRISLGGEVWDDAATGAFTPALRRRAALVFQDHRLFPHLSVLDNVAFGVRAAGAGTRAARRQAAGWLDRLGLTALAAHRPRELSGGQSQRVALARALASAPRLLLLDEPLASLDVRARQQVRGELRNHLRDFAGPCLVVTHDPLEALALADTIMVLEAGRTVQLGAPALLASRPATRYVAAVMGLNLYAGTLADPGTGRIDLDGGGVLHAALDPRPRGARVLAAVAPSAITVHSRRPPPGAPGTTWQGVVGDLELLVDRVRVSVAGPPDAVVTLPPAAVSTLELTAGREVWLQVKTADVLGYPDPHPGSTTEVPGRRP
jgi:molybdate transport system ATP-binding protein